MALDAAVDLARRHRNRMISNFGANTLAEGCLGGLFDKAAVIRLLNQPGVTHLRFYYGEGPDGKRHVILVGAAGDDDDFATTGAVVLQDHWECPPVCPKKASVLRTG
jgi:hypothetical protein